MGGNDENLVVEDRIEHPDPIPAVEEPVAHNLRNRENLKIPARYKDFELYLCSEGANLKFHDCLTDPKWQAAIRDEIESLNKNKVWAYVNRKKAGTEKIISSRWVFKQKEDGTYKARLVARGFEQSKTTLDYKDTFSPVVDTGNLRLLFALGAILKMNIKSFDVKTAFLNGYLDNPVYMEVPEGFESNGKICELKKALYGLKQAPQRWFARLSTLLKEFGLVSTKGDKCLFKNSTSSLFLAIHVDDGILFGVNLFGNGNNSDRTRHHVDTIRLCKKGSGKVQHAGLSSSSYTDGSKKNCFGSWGDIKCPKTKINISLQRGSWQPTIPNM